MTAPRQIVRVGRLGPWHRRLSYLVLGACAATGVVWFVLLDVVGLPPPAVVPWWIGHGSTALLATLAIGAALPNHVPASWRHFRNRWLGGFTLGLLAVVVASTALLFYGPEDWHPAAHWVHVGAGLLGLVVFSLHAWRGRHSVGKTIAVARTRERH